MNLFRPDKEKGNEKEVTSNIKRATITCTSEKPKIKFVLAELQFSFCITTTANKLMAIVNGLTLN